MNHNLQQIFSRYIEKFDYLEGGENNENYKWGIAKGFRELMEEALSKDGQEFADALYRAKAVTSNIIDSYTQPFHGLVEFARQEPKTVKQMFLDLYADDGGNLKIQEKLIANFFAKSEELLNKYFPDSYRYKQNSHSVSAYLFLYDPEHHYMYKATQASIFADCMGFYNDWGYGDSIKLDVFYRMCDQLVDEIMQTEELLEVDATRFDGRFGTEPEDMIEDEAKHMLAFDIIYCCSVYNLFDGISFSRPKTKEKQEYVQNKAKAEGRLAEYHKAVDSLALLEDGLKCILRMLPIGAIVKHKKYGTGQIILADENRLEVKFDNGEVKVLGTAISIGNKIIYAESAEYDSCYEKYGGMIAKADAVRSAVERAKNALSAYEEYL